MKTESTLCELACPQVPLYSASESVEVSVGQAHVGFGFSIDETSGANGLMDMENSHHNASIKFSFVYGVLPVNKESRAPSRATLA